MPRLRIEAGDVPGQIWIIIGVVLVGSALSDVLIVMAQIAGLAHWQPWIIRTYSSGTLLIIGALSLSSVLDTQPEVEEVPSVQITQADTQIVARLDALMEAERPYLDPDLMLSRLSRRLIIPVKQLSAAINMVTGANVSRYISGARMNAAQNTVVAWESVTDAMLSSGFNTKSNFNREFLRFMGVAPSDWVADR